MGSVLFEEKNRCSGRRFQTRARPDDCRVERILQVHRRLCRQGLEASAGSILLLARPPPPPSPTPSFQHNCVSSSWVWVLGKRQAGGSEAWNGWVSAERACTISLILERFWLLRKPTSPLAPFLKPGGSMQEHGLWAPKNSDLSSSSPSRSVLLAQGTLCDCGSRGNRKRRPARAGRGRSQPVQPGNAQAKVCPRRCTLCQEPCSAGLGTGRCPWATLTVSSSRTSAS